MRLIVVSVLLGLFATQAVAQEKKAAGKPGAVVVDAASITATVEAIDYDKRTVALKGPRGNVVELKVSPDVKNFKQIKPGDRVTTKYFESTAIFVRKPDEPPFAEGASAVQVAAPAQKPGVIAVDTIEMTARVEDINYKNRTVTLRGPQQKTVTFKVGKEVKRFDEVKKGDEVVVRHTEQLAVRRRRNKEFKLSCFFRNLCDCMQRIQSSPTEPDESLGLRNRS